MGRLIMRKANISSCAMCRSFSMNQIIVHFIVLHSFFEEGILDYLLLEIEHFKLCNAYELSMNEIIVPFIVFQ